MDNKTYSLNEIQEIVTPIAQSYGISRLSLFGSYARGDATSDSDIDLLILDKGQLRGLFQLAGFHLELEEKFAVHVDVLTIGGLDEDFLDGIKEEEVILYEAS